MPRKPDPDLDERTARLGREWFAQVRRQEREEAAEETRRRARRHADGGLYESLFGEADDGECGGD